MKVTANSYRISYSGDIEPEDIPVPEGNAAVDGEWPDTKCAFCKKDHPTPLEKLSTFPICEACKIDHDKKIFPLWVKLFFAGILVIVVFSITWNARFFSAYIDVKRSMSANAAGDITNAAGFMTNAAAEVPEGADISKLAHYYKGLDLLMKDHSKLALAELRNCEGLPAELLVNELVSQAETGAAFDDKNYPLFLKISKEHLLSDTTKAQSWAGVSSAYACLYATTNTDSLKDQAIKYYNKAKTIDDTSAAAKEYYGFILYRINSKNIISREQFSKQFPKGYPPK